ncbi:hypothetical protein KKC52_03695 [bacterium]|nr:hypothetical protein [bacterium]
MKKVLILTIILSLGSVSASWAEFLFEGAGVRPISMGGAFVGLADDANCVYYNPAGLAYLKEREELFMYGSRFDLVKISQVTLAQKNMGFSLLRQKADLYKSKDHPDGSAMSESIFALAFGRELFPNSAFPVALGGSLTFLLLDSTEGNDGGIGLDLGMLVKWKEGISAGLSIRNAATEVRGEEVPVVVATGVAYEVRKGIVIATDLAVRKGENKTSKSFHLGAEMEILEVIRLRGGINNGAIIFGMGFAQGNWQLDGAYSIFNSDLDTKDAFYFDVGFKF